MRWPEIIVVSVKWMGRLKRSKFSSTFKVFSIPHQPWCMCDWMPIASNLMPASRQPSTRMSYADETSKSLMSKVAFGLVSRAASNIVLIVLMRPYSLQMRVMPLSYLSKTGMMTASLITSHMSISPRKSDTSRWMRALCAARISELLIESSQSTVSVCQQSG